MKNVRIWIEKVCIIKITLGIFPHVDNFDVGIERNDVVLLLHPPYSPNLAPGEFVCFLRKKNYGFNAEMEKAVNQPFFKMGIFPHVYDLNVN